MLAPCGRKYMQIYAEQYAEKVPQRQSLLAVIRGGGQSMNLLGDSKAISMLCRQFRIWGPKGATGQSHGVGWTHVILVSKGHNVVHSSQAFHNFMPYPSTNAFSYCLCCCCPWSWTTALAKATWSHRPRRYMRTMTSSCGVRRWWAVLWNQV